MMGLSVSVIIPTYNGEKSIGPLLKNIQQQSINNIEVIVIDSTSTDDTRLIAAIYGAKIIDIPQSSFDHGGTRNIAAKASHGDIIIMITQDVILKGENSLENLIKSFDENPKIGAVFGRQFPRSDANSFASHLRLFNYPERSYTRSFEDKKKYGIKTAFFSDSFSAYRRKALEQTGWFKERLIVGEDSLACAKILMQGWLIYYCAEAAVYHSHNYSLRQDFSRYFDTGVFHANEKWLIDTFGKTDREGIKYVFSEMAYLISNRYFFLLPVSVIRSGLKMLGYKLGLKYLHFPRKIRKLLSMHQFWWDKLNQKEGKQ